MAYTTTHIQKDNPPQFTRFMKFRVLCGHCSFKCCNSPSFEVETTEEESKRMGLPRRFPQEGKCHCLTKNGCKFGGERPVYCQLFPLQVDKNNKLVLSHWAVLHCPNTRDYDISSCSESQSTSGVEYFYHKKDDKMKNKPNNSHQSITLKRQKLEDFPTVVEMCKEAIIHFWGLAYYERALAYATKPEPEGFGFIHSL